jgi:hypothetical protein
MRKRLAAFAGTVQRIVRQWKCAHGFHACDATTFERWQKDGMNWKCKHCTWATKDVNEALAWRVPK